MMNFERSMLNKLQIKEYWYEKKIVNSLNNSHVKLKPYCKQKMKIEFYNKTMNKNLKT